MSHPYTTTIAGMVATIRQLRSTFPATVGADTLRKWSIAPKNEAPIIVVLRYLGLIDDEGKKVADNAKAFVEHDDTAFAKQFESIVKAAYSDLFDTWGDSSWTLEKNKLIGFFRNADSTSARVGQEQAATFLALAGLAGHGVAPSSSPPVPKPSGGGKKGRTKSERPPASNSANINSPKAADIGAAITLRVEINLPVTDDQSVYDSIFKSIKAHLLNA